jgi:hypothetical protein
VQYCNGRQCVKNFNTNKEAPDDETKRSKQLECSKTQELQQAKWLCWTMNSEYLPKKKKYNYMPKCKWLWTFCPHNKGVNDIA